MSGHPQLTRFLDNDVLARVERLRIDHRHHFTNRATGERRSRRSGSSIEFRDYRDYVAGDDIRHVDWNIFARLHRPYVRQFHDEEEVHVAILVDASRSMAVEGKLERALQLAAAFGVMALFGGDRLGVHAFGPGVQACLPRGRGRVAVSRLFDALERIEPGGAVPLESGVDGMLRTHSGRGSLFVFSDFLTGGDVSRAFQAAASRGLAVHGVQVLAGSELEPELDSDVRLVDSETDETLDVSGLESLLELYHEHRNELTARLAGLCRQHGGRFATCDAREELADVLRRFVREGWIR